MTDQLVFVLLSTINQENFEIGIWRSSSKVASKILLFSILRIHEIILVHATRFVIYMNSSTSFHCEELFCSQWRFSSIFY